MSGLAPLLAGHVAPGVHRWDSHLDVDDVARAAGTAGWAFAHLDGVRVADRTEFLASVGEVLDFPETYGVNFDALADLLDDLTGPTLLLWDEWGTFARQDPRWFAVALEILTLRSGEHGSAPFAVLLRGDGPDLPSVTVLE